MWCNKIRPSVFQSYYLDGALGMAKWLYKQMNQTVLLMDTFVSLRY